MTTSASDGVSGGSLDDFRQGDHLPQLRNVPVLGATGELEKFEAVEGVILISQTCDVVLDKFDYVQVAGLVRLGAADAATARDGSRPRYVHLPALGGDVFVDLHVSGSLHKNNLVDIERRPGVSSDLEIRTLAEALGRRSSRFAFPDNIQPWFRPLESTVRSKYPRENSSLGQVLHHVYQFRVEASGGWNRYPLSLQLVVIVNRDVLPSFSEDELPPPPLSSGISAFRARKPVPAEVADRLVTAVDAADRHALWMEFGAACARQCVPRDPTPEIAAASGPVTTDVVPVDEFPLARIMNSERLDLDHLSDPAPWRASAN